VTNDAYRGNRPAASCAYLRLQVSRPINTAQRMWICVGFSIFVPNRRNSRDVDAKSIYVMACHLPPPTKSEQQTLGQVQPRGSRGNTGKDNNHSHPREPRVPRG